MHDFFLTIKNTPLRNRLKERHLDVCCKVAIDGPNQEVLDSIKTASGGIQDETKEGQMF